MKALKAKDCKVSLPDGKSGDWRIEKFAISDDEAKSFNLSNYVFSSISDCSRDIIAGEYTKLIYKNDVVMSDTPAEIRDHLDFLKYARGDILITGLGIGMVATALSKIDEVNSITIIEQSQDVIDLVADHINNYKTRVIHDSAFTWNPDMDFNYAWHDIWTPICSDNLKEMALLSYHYKDNVENQDFWCYKKCKELAENSDSTSLFGAVSKNLPTNPEEYITVIEQEEYSLLPKLIANESDDMECFDEKLDENMQSLVLQVPLKSDLKNDNDNFFGVSLSNGLF